jgi:hypothetical protein
VAETKDRSLAPARPIEGPILRRPSAGAMGAAGAARTFGGFLRWFFLGSLGNDLSGLAHGSKPVIDARRAVGFYLVARVALVVIFAFLVGWSLREPVLAAILLGGLLGLAGAWFTTRARARGFVIDAATRDLTTTPALDPAAVTVPRLLPSHALGKLAVAVDAVRRGDVVLADRVSSDVDEAMLELDERRLLSGVRALVADRTGDKKRAGRELLVAFPVGAPDIDQRLGRIFAEMNWHDATRLARAYDEWVVNGFEPHADDPLGRILLLIELKLGRRQPSDVGAARVVLETEARSLGDRELADRIREAALASADARYR